MTSTCSNVDWPCRPGNDWPRPGTWRPAAPVPTSPRRSRPGARPHPRRTADEHQGEPERQVLDRRIGNAAITEEDDPPRTQDGFVAVADDATAGQPAVGEQLEDHDDSICLPPGSRAHQGGPQDE